MLLILTTCTATTASLDWNNASPTNFITFNIVLMVV